MAHFSFDFYRELGRRYCLFVGSLHLNDGDAYSTIAGHLRCLLCSGNWSRYDERSWGNQWALNSGCSSNFLGPIFHRRYLRHHIAAVCHYLLGLPYFGGCLSDSSYRGQGENHSHYSC